MDFLEVKEAVLDLRTVYWCTEFYCVVCSSKDWWICETANTSNRIPLKEHLFTNNENLFYEKVTLADKRMFLAERLSDFNMLSDELINLAYDEVKELI